MSKDSPIHELFLNRHFPLAYVTQCSGGKSIQLPWGKGLKFKLCLLQNICAANRKSLLTKTIYHYSTEFKNTSFKKHKVLKFFLLCQGLRLKICDFGFSRETASTMTSNIGTIGYQAPELLKVGESLVRFQRALAQLFCF